MSGSWTTDLSPMGDGDWAHLKHFAKSEFAAPEKMGRSFLHWLDQVREMAGVPMRITSSYRSHAHNVEVGGAQDSAHLDELCQAVDIMPSDSVARFKILQAAVALGCRRIGVYGNGSLHLDRTEDVRPAPVLWTVVSHVATS